MLASPFSLSGTPSREALLISSATIVNRALNLAGCEVTIADLQDGTREAQIALQHYTMTVWALLRVQDHEFSRKIAALALSGQVAPPGWTYEYLLPTDYLKVRSIVPGDASPNNPLPVRWNVGTNAIGGVETNVIWSSVPGAKLAYTSNLVTEDNWDGAFIETVVQYLSETLAPLLAPKDAKGQPSKDAAPGYAQAARIMQLDMDKDS